MAVATIRKSTLCSTLGNDTKPSILDQAIFKFNGITGDKVIIPLESNPAEAGSGKRATLILAPQKMPRSYLSKHIKAYSLNKIAAMLPVAAKCFITVAEQPKIPRGERYRGAYCLSLEASPEIRQTLKPALWVE